MKTPDKQWHIYNKLEEMFEDFGRYGKGKIVQESLLSMIVDIPLTLGGLSAMVELQNLYSLVASHIRSYLELIESIYPTVLFLPREPNYPGTRKQYSVEKVLYSSILCEHPESGSHARYGLFHTGRR